MPKTKLNQEVSQNSTALQANHDINITSGLTYDQARDLFQLLFISNFPKLQKQVFATARRNIDDLCEKFEAQLMQRSKAIVVERLADPDVQAMINDVVLSCARKGTRANPSLLSSLIVERITGPSSDYLDIIFSEAVTVIPKLTKQQIALLSFVFYILNVHYSELSDLSELEKYGQEILQFATPGFSLSYMQKQHLVYTGACTIIDLKGIRIYNMYHESICSSIFTGTFDEFKRELRTKAPSFDSILKIFNDENLGSISLTNIGRAIALAYLSIYIGEIDYTAWFK
jgi:hypothetical protein